jgi:hypothetical protein
VVDACAGRFQNVGTGEVWAKGALDGMAQEGNAVEQAVARAVRDNLQRIQQTAEDLHHAVSDVVAACSSNKPTNALPPLLRAQTAAASLGAAMEVLSRFIAVALQPGPRTAVEAQVTSLISSVAIPAPAAPERPAAPQATPQPVGKHKPAPAPPPEPEYVPEAEPMPPSVPGSATEPEYDAQFDVNRLSAEEQELHRRANRVAKVSMQDIKMLRPEQVRLGRENKDICIRLKDDIEKAHREYDRRFKPIMDHPVDYFYRWLVEILAEGDPNALGEYPYAPSAKHH